MLRQSPTIPTTLRKTSKKDQKRLGSYPVPAEMELLWKNRTTAHCEWIQQSVSAYQMKVMWPMIHSFPAATWAKFSGMFWPVFWPLILTNLVLFKMFYDAEKDVRNKYWY